MHKVLFDKHSDLLDSGRQLTRAEPTRDIENWQVKATVIAMAKPSESSAVGFEHSTDHQPSRPIAGILAANLPKKSTVYVEVHMLR